MPETASTRALCSPGLSQAFLVLLLGPICAGLTPLPECDLVAVAYLGDSGRSCLHMPQEAPKPPKVQLHGGCHDTPGWFDGTNGCPAYARNSHFCEKYGGIRHAQGGAARDHCCACGGGLKLKFGPNDEVEVRAPTSGGGGGGRWEPAVVVHARPSLDVAYVVRLWAGGLHRVEVTSLKSIRRPRVPRRLALQQCRADKAQVWRLVPAAEPNGSSSSGASRSKSYLVSMDNPSTNLTLGAQNRRQVVSRGAGSPTLKLTPVWDRFPHVWQLAHTPEDSKLPEDDCLIGGSFGKPPFKEPQWVSCSREYKNPYSQWLLRCVSGEGPDGDGGSVVDHVAWMRKEASTNTGREILERLPPWILLNIERDAPPEVVKENFRALSRLLHPDKQRSDEDREVAENLFPLIQRAQSGLKADKAESFRRDAEVDELLYARSRHVVELDVEALRRIARGAARQPSRNGTERSAADDGGAAWIVFLYSSSCSMSRMIVPYVEMAAEALQMRNVRVGAFGCGLHGQSRLATKKKGHQAVFEDPACMEFGVITETPTCFVVGPGFQQHFGSVMAESLPERLLDFGERARRRIDRQHLLAYATPALLASESFTSEKWVVGFRQHGSPGASRAAHDAVASHILAVAPRLAEAGVRVALADCAEEAADEGGAAGEEVDCAAEGVAWLPDVRLYGAGRGPGRGRSVLGHPFSDARDVEVALEAMTGALTVDLEDEAPLAERPAEGEEAAPEEEGGSMSCGGRPAEGPPAPPAEGFLEDSRQELLQEPRRPRAPQKGAASPRLANEQSPQLTARAPKAPKGRGMAYRGGGGAAGGGLLQR